MAKKLAKKLAKPELIPQPGGRGALYAGGVPGHDGSGTGRPKDSVREAFRGDIPTARAKLLEKLERDELKPAELINYIDKCAKYSIGKPISHDELAGILGRMWDVVVAHNDIEDPAKRLTAVQRDWTRMNA